MTHTQQPQQTGRRLERRSGDRILAGVASGIADHIDINVWFVRLAFFVLAFAGGFGVLAYITAWIVIPREDEDDALVTQWIERFDTSDAGKLFGFLLVALAGIVVIAQVADVSTVLVIAAVLFIVGFLLYRGDLSSSVVIHRTDPTPPSNDAEPHEGDDDVVEDGLDAAMASAVVATEGGGPRRPRRERSERQERREGRPRREPSMLGRITIAVGLIVLATMALVDMAFARVEILPIHYLATAAGVLGLGLVVGAWIGRARWLAIVGFFLLPVLWVAAIAPTSWSFDAGDRFYTPASVNEVQSEYRLGAGTLSLDLSDLTGDELASVGSIELSMGAGEVTVYLPSDASAFLDLRVGAGEISGPFRTVSGIGAEVTEDIGLVPVGGPPDFTLKADVGLGVISIIVVTELQEVTP